MAATMEIESDDDTLRKLAAGGTMDYAAWPLLLTTVVSRIERIAYNDFPVPRIPQPTAAPQLPSAAEPRFLAPLPPSSDPAEPASAEPTVEAPRAGAPNEFSSSQETNKENAAPEPAPEPRPAAQELPSTKVQDEPAALEPDILPPQIAAMLAEITGVLNDTFHTYPPHTIQRLAELVLSPRQHYKSLPSYLHAVDRVVHVTSGSNIYPLPPAIPDMSHMSINGVTDTQPQQESSANDTTTGSAVWANASSANGAAIGSDEALGGALLTPIPWLARRTGTGDGGSESGESSTLGSEGGPSPLASAAPPLQQQQTQQQQQQQRPQSSQSQQSSSARKFDMQVRTESTETIEGPNGMGSIETVSVSVNGIPSIGAQQRVITQGELIRQEQRAGVVPVSQLARNGPVVVTSSGAPASNDTPMAVEGGATEDRDRAERDSAAKDATPDQSGSEKPDKDMADGDDEEDEAPHARGPDIIGAADMGPQNATSSTFSISSGGNVEMRGIDVEAAVGRKHEPQPAVERSTSSDDHDDDNGAASKPADKAEGERPAVARSRSPAAAAGKREAEDDISETESVSSKRLKGSPEAEDGPPPAAAAATNEPEEQGEEGRESNNKEEEEQEESRKKKDSEGDVVIEDASAAKEDDGGTPAVTAKEAGEEKQEKAGAKEDDEKKPTEPTG